MQRCTRGRRDITVGCGYRWNKSSRLQGPKIGGVVWDVQVEVKFMILGCINQTWAEHTQSSVMQAEVRGETLATYKLLSMSLSLQLRNINSDGKRSFVFMSQLLDPDPVWPTRLILFWIITEPGLCLFHVIIIYRYFSNMSNSWLPTDYSSVCPCCQESLRWLLSPSDQWLRNLWKSPILIVILIILI